MVRLFPQLTDEEEVIYNWQYGFAGDFTIGLMRLITQADIENQERLEKGFPLEVGAYHRFIYEMGWWQEVERKVHVKAEPNEKEPKDAEPRKETGSTKA